MRYHKNDTVHCYGITNIVVIGSMPLFYCIEC